MIFVVLRVKELKDELESMKNRVTIAERNASSYDAQRKSTLADMVALQKKVGLQLEACGCNTGMVYAIISVLEG